jgi:hypothetical protein
MQSRIGALLPLLLALPACGPTMTYVATRDQRLVERPLPDGAVTVFAGTEPAAPFVSLGVIMVDQQGGAITKLDDHFLAKLRSAAAKQGCTGVIIPPMVSESLAGHTTAFQGFPVNCVLHGPAAEKLAVGAAGEVVRNGPAGAGRPSPMPGATPAARRWLAVLEFRNYAKDLKPENVRYLTDLARSAALQRADRYQVLTRENLLSLLEANGKSLASCEGECEVETGRRIGAEAIVSGELQRFGAGYRLSLKLHETAEGRLLATAFASGADLEGLERGMTTALRELLAPVAGR